MREWLERAAGDRGPDIASDDLERLEQAIAAACRGEATEAREHCIRIAQSASLVLENRYWTAAGYYISRALCRAGDPTSVPELSPI